MLNNVITASREYGDTVKKTKAMIATKTEVST